MIERDEFRAWLEGKNDRDEVGIRCSGGLCPIAMWLREARDANIPIVNGDTISWAEKTGDKKRPWAFHNLETPEWATEFIDRIDREHDLEGIEGQPVSADEARRALAGDY